MAEYTRGRETSDALVEVRTVLSRAENALSTLEVRRAQDGTDWYGREYHADPEIEEMIGTLQEVVRQLDRWRRTGAKRKGRP